MTMLSANGLEMHCRLLNAEPEKAVGETVVFIHGIGTDSLASFYLTLAPPMAAAGIDVVTYDLRGHGRTERPRNGYTVGDFVDDLHALLGELDLHEPARPVHLVGNSFGGTVAFSYAERYPHRVASIVSIEAEPPTELWSSRIAEVLGNTVEFLHDETAFNWVEEHYGSHHRRLAKAAAERITATTMVEEIPVGPLLSVEDIAMLQVPVLSVLGGEGYQSRNLEGLTSLLPNAELHVFPQQNHSVLVERHLEVRDLVSDWILAHRSPVTVPAAEELLPWPTS